MTSRNPVWIRAVLASLGKVRTVATRSLSTHPTLMLWVTFAIVFIWDPWVAR